MAPAKVVFYFLVGLALGAFFVTVADRVYEGGWRGGPTIVALSLPVTIAYFVALWAVAVWRSWPLNGGRADYGGLLMRNFPVLLRFLPGLLPAPCLCSACGFSSNRLADWSITLFAKFGSR